MIEATLGFATRSSKPEYGLGTEPFRAFGSVHQPVEDELEAFAMGAHAAQESAHSLIACARLIARQTAPGEAAIDYADHRTSSDEWDLSPP